MRADSSNTAVVRLRLPKGGGVSEVAVGVSVHLRGTGKQQVSYHWGSQPSGTLSADPECSELFRTPERLEIACQLAVHSGVAGLQRSCPLSFEWWITRLEGSNLSSACTVGFCLAGFMATARALGHAAEPEDMLGWALVASQ
jgi:hypothetical protein